MKRHATSGGEVGIPFGSGCIVSGSIVYECGIDGIKRSVRIHPATVFDDQFVVDGFRATGSKIDSSRSRRELDIPKIEITLGVHISGAFENDGASKTAAGEVSGGGAFHATII